MNREPTPCRCRVCAAEVPRTDRRRHLASHGWPAVERIPAVFLERYFLPPAAEMEAAP